ncbi:MAG: SDR family oxidoreductase [Acidobacteriaceae bacterium]|nr:SDR family oxidoreductase [Acidobacteriaceae bacterium]
MSDLTGKRAIVTGGSKGIGLEVARALLGEGVSVVICARDSHQVDRAVNELSGKAGRARIAGKATDVSDVAAVAELFRYADGELGGLDILVNNAGFGRFRATAELSVEEWNQVIATNLSGAFYCSREALQRFHSRGGWVINISSLAGKNPFAGGAAYNASKFGLNGFSEAMMLDHRNDNVRVSYIMPGSVDTGFGSGETGGAKSDWKIAPEDVAAIAINILRMPARTLISRVEVRPSRPRKN